MMNQNIMNPSFTLDRTIFYDQQLYFRKQNKEFGHYLSISLPKNPIDQLRHEICQHYKVELKHRDESHLTLITPFEYEHHLKPYLEPATLEALAQDYLPLPLDFEVMGIGCVTKDKESYISFFILIKEKRIFNFRSSIKSELENINKEKTNFNPFDYYPHITIGFNHHDLHKERDGIIKDASSLIENIILT